MNKGLIYRTLQFFAAAVFLIVAAIPNAMAVGYFAQAGKIYNANGQEIQIRGISHYGFNTKILQPQHLWDMGWKEQIAQIKSLGFNAIRLPFVPDVIYNTTPLNQLGSYIDPGLNRDLLTKTPLEALDAWMAEANRQGMYILLDFHSVSKELQYPTWFLSDPNDFYLTHNKAAYTKENWAQDLAFVAQRYAKLPYFFAIDIYNEPHGPLVRWNAGDARWKPAAEFAAAAVLAANPNLLIFVQGINGNFDGIEDSSIPTNWGENLQPQAYQPLNIPTDKLVLTPHTYGPDVYVKTSFSAPTFPANLAAHWNTLFGQFSQKYAVVIGEWGGKYGQGTAGQQDIIWQNAFVEYLLRKNIRNTFYWCYTPDSFDSGGILDDNLNPRQDKLALLKKLWGSTTPVVPPPVVQPVPVVPTPAVRSQAIFDDAITPLWVLGGWSSTTTVQNQFVKTGGSAVKVDATTWGGVSFDSRDVNWTWVDQPANLYTHLSFYVSAGPVVGAAISSLEASLDLGWGLSAKISNYVTSFAPGAWYHVEIPLSLMNPKSIAFRKIVFQNNSTSNLTFYVDKVELVNRKTTPIPVRPPIAPIPVTPSPVIPGSTQLQSCANIMALGDSITLGMNGGFRNNLYTGLLQNNCGVSYVGTQSDQWTRVADKDHEGHPGFTIGNIASSVNAWMVSTQPNIILLMAGTNDLAWWTAENASQIGARHNALIDQLRTARPNAWIFVASIPPQASAIIQPNNIDRALLAQQFNAVIRKNVETRAVAGQRVRFVDVNSVLTTADLYDGIHPTEAAHAKIARKFLDGIRAALGASSTTPTPAGTAVRQQRPGL